MSQYVSGKTVPRADILHFLAQTMEVEAAWLSGEEPSPIEKENAGGNEMRIFKKSSKLDNVLYDVRGPVVDEAERMTAAGTQVLKLNIGNPAPFGFRTPDEVIYDMRQDLPNVRATLLLRGYFLPEKPLCSMLSFGRFLMFLLKIFIREMVSVS